MLCSFNNPSLHLTPHPTNSVHYYRPAPPLNSVPGSLSPPSKGQGLSTSSARVQCKGQLNGSMCAYFRRVTLKPRSMPLRHWDAIVVAPSDLGEMIIDDLHTGSALVFTLNLFTSLCFQFLGFIITYFSRQAWPYLHPIRCVLAGGSEYGGGIIGGGTAGNRLVERNHDGDWLDTDSGADPTTTALLDSMANQNGPGIGGMYKNGVEFGGGD